jgi:hypothetical protein
VSGGGADSGERIGSGAVRLWRPAWHRNAIAPLPEAALFDLVYHILGRKSDATTQPGTLIRALMVQWPRTASQSDPVQMRTVAYERPAKNSGTRCIPKPHLKACAKAKAAAVHRAPVRKPCRLAIALTTNPLKINSSRKGATKLESELDTTAAT